MSINDTVNPAMSRSLGYDSIGRLTSAAGPWGAGTIAYDGAGNLLSQSLGSFSLNYAYNAQNRLSSVSGSRSASFGYDVLGNISSAGASSYSYDASPNMRCANCNAANRVDYAYDGLARRVSSTKSGNSSYELHSTNGELLAEYSPSESNKLIEYIYLGGRRIAQRVSDNRPATTISAVKTTLIAHRVNGVTLTVNIGGSAPTGSVVFMSGGEFIGIADVVNGQATIQVEGLALGNHTITATYSGDGANGSNTLVFQTRLVNLDWLPAVLEILN